MTLEQEYQIAKDFAENPPLTWYIYFRGFGLIGAFVCWVCASFASYNAQFWWACALVAFIAMYIVGAVVSLIKSKAFRCYIKHYTLPIVVVCAAILTKIYPELDLEEIKKRIK